LLRSAGGRRRRRRAHGEALVSQVHRRRGCCY
jgi:hypothetical protein